MSGYRPICDTWWLARCKYKGKVKRYGGYLGGFPERARVLIGCPLDQPLLHVCGGLAKQYPYQRAIGPLDKTMDLDFSVEPDFLMDVRSPDWPLGIGGEPRINPEIWWGGILADPPYSEPDAEMYPPGQETYPNPHDIVKTGINVLRVGYRIGIIHYIVPRCPKNAKFIGFVGIGCGFQNRIRAFSVYERI